MKTKHLISISDLEKEDILEILETAKNLKKKSVAVCRSNSNRLMKQARHFRPLQGKTLAMIFSKPSTRTRVSFETGIYQLGGLGLFLSGQELQLGRGETIADTARTLSKYVSGVMMRTFNHNDVVEFAKYSTVPVINGLTDLEHPCQALGDIFTIIEKKSQINKLKNLRFVFVGDGNNVVNSLMLLCAKLSMTFTVVSPSGYEPSKNIFKMTENISKKTGALINVSNNIKDVAGADVIYTDVWTSMGQESEREKRLSIFRPYQVNSSLLSRAKPDCIVMHCLPAKRGEEITDDVIDSKKSVVFDQAENRLHIQKAIMFLLMK